MQLCPSHSDKKRQDKTTHRAHDVGSTLFQRWLNVTSVETTLIQRHVTGGKDFISTGYNPILELDNYNYNHIKYTIRNNNNMHR